MGRRALQTLRQTTLSQFQERLRDIIPIHLLSQEDDGNFSRERFFNLRFTGECLIWQMLKPGTACREVVRQAQALARLLGKTPPSQEDSAYIQARQKLPKEKMKALLKATAQAAQSRTTVEFSLKGRPVKVVDGSSAQAADTAKNQKRYPQSSQQKKGCGFPVVKFVVLFCLGCGNAACWFVGRVRPEKRTLREECILPWSLDSSH